MLLSVFEGEFQQLEWTILRWHVKDYALVCPTALKVTEQCLIGYAGLQLTEVRVTDHTNALTR
jgi:hypothetical protein